MAQKDTFIKGFDENLCCRGMQFEIGKTYEIENDVNEELELCTSKVFHFCRSLQQVHEYYKANPSNTNRFCEIEVLGKLVESDNKCGSNKIHIVREIKGEELDLLRGLTKGNTGLFNTGHYNTGDRNAGDCNTGDCNTGGRNTGDCNTGRYNTGDYNTGDCNIGYYNTGDRNTGNRNTGRYNIGDCNTGDRNTGDCNTGDYNTGDYNTGDCNTGGRNTGRYNTGRYNTGNRNTGHWNSCERSTGLFNTKETTILIFNEDSKLTFSECVHMEWYGLLFKKSLELTKWIPYTDEEKKNSIIRQCIGGYFKEYTFEEACQNWWNKYSKEEKEYLINNIPNFDKDIFKEITGIEV